MRDICACTRFRLALPALGKERDWVHLLYQLIWMHNGCHCDICPMCICQPQNVSWQSRGAAASTGRGNSVNWMTWQIQTKIEIIQIAIRSIWMDMCILICNSWAYQVNWGIWQTHDYVFAISQPTRCHGDIWLALPTIALRITRKADKPWAAQYNWWWESW